MPINVNTPGSPINSANGSHKTEGSDGISPEVSKQNGLDKSVDDKNNKITYVDPAADVSLVSLEGRVFKVESYVLKAHSAFFLDKLQQHDDKGTSFDIAAPSRVLKAWLDLAHLHNRPPKMIWKMRKLLFELCEHLGSRGVAERALFLMHSSVEKDPWELFCLASQKNNVGLAKSALRALAEIKDNGGHVPAVDGITPTLAAGLTLPYLLGLYVAALKGKEKVAGMTRQAGYAHSSHPSSAIDSDYGGLKEENGWKVIAEKFAPVTG